MKREDKKRKQQSTPHSAFGTLLHIFFALRSMLYAQRSALPTPHFAFCVFLLFLLIPLQVFAQPIEAAVSINPLSDIVKRLGGEDVRVSVMLPPGASPHTYEPKPKDMIKFQNVRLFVMVGEGLDFWVEKIAKSAKKTPDILKITEGMPLISLDHDHDHGKSKLSTPRAPHLKDPHIWLDPVLTTEAAEKINKKLASLRPEKAMDFNRNFLRLKEDLKTLDGEIKEAVASFGSRKIITFHNAWGYFARRYGLNIEEVLIDVPGKEPSPKKIKKVIDKIKAQRIRTIFIEPQFNPKIAEVIAKEAGANVIVLDPIGGADGRKTYLELMRYNLEQMGKGLR